MSKSKFKYIGFENWFFSYQKIPYKFFEIKMFEYQFKFDGKIQDIKLIKIRLQVLKFMFFFEYKNN